MKKEYVIDTVGNKYWILNNTLHRENGPAIECSNGYKAWYINGKLHREDGPAVEYSGDGRWYLNDKQTSEEEVRKYKLIKEMAGI